VIILFNLSLICNDKSGKFNPIGRLIILISFVPPVVDDKSKSVSISKLDVKVWYTFESVLNE
jgi:hypothetical protein